MSTAEESGNDSSGYESPSSSRPGPPTLLGPETGSYPLLVARRKHQLMTSIAATGPPLSGSIRENIVASAVKEDRLRAGDTDRKGENANAVVNDWKDYSRSDEAQFFKPGFLDLVDEEPLEKVQDSPPLSAKTSSPLTVSIDGEEVGTPVQSATSTTGPARDTPIARTQNGQKSRLGPSTAESRYILFAEEVSKCSVGPLNVKVFLEEFLRLPVSDMPEPKDAFNQVPEDPTVEKQIYEPLIKAVNEGARCPGVTFVDTSVSSDRRQGIFKPKITGYRPEDLERLTPIRDERSEVDSERPRVSVATRTQPTRKAKEVATQKVKDATSSEPRKAMRYRANLGLAELFIEIKMRGFDPFRDEHDHTDSKKKMLFSWEDKSFDDGDKTKQPKKTLGQIAAYASEAFARQHRMLYFSVLIIGTCARLFRWDHAGVVFTKSFDYRQQPELLCEFLWRFSNADQVMRGFDPTVTVASKEEEELFRAIVSEEVAFQLGLSTELDRHLRLHYEKGKVTKMRIFSAMAFEWQEYLVSVPIASPRTFAGRGTRAYWSVKILPGEQEKIKGRVAFLKDIWRIRLEGMDTEGQVYEDMHEGKVKRIPGLLAYGDVPLHPDPSAQSGKRPEHERPQFEPQTTRTQDFTTVLCSCVNSAAKRRRIIKHTHFRIALDEVGYPLRNFENSRELFLGGEHVFEALDSAYEYNRRLHRDVSLDNIILVRNRASGKREGRLVDWEFSTIENPGRLGGDYFRSGTWAFMSAQALNAENDSFKHTRADDLESLFYALMYASLLWLPHTEIENFGEWMFRFFDDRMILDGRNSGGMTKRDYIVESDRFIRQFQFNEPIQSWLAALYEALGTTAPILRKRDVPLEWTRQFFKKEMDKIHDSLDDVWESDRVEHDVSDYHVAVLEVFYVTHTSLVYSGFDVPAPTGEIEVSKPRGSKRRHEEFGAEERVDDERYDKRTKPMR